VNIDHEVKLDYSDVLLTPVRSSLSSRSEVSVNLDFFGTDVVPIIAANMDGVGTFEMAKELAKYKMMTALTKHYSLEQLVDFYSDVDNESLVSYAIYSMGTSEIDRKKFVDFNLERESLSFDGPMAVCVDVANGYTKQFEEFLTEFSETYPEYILIAGNVVTPEQTDRLIECGVDVVKVGVGPGSVCTTRKIAGVGYPQLSAVIECSEAARDAGGRIIADGGCTCPGDMAKAFAAGADLVMLGGYFAGHYEGGVMQNGPGTVPFYGMASHAAQHLHNGGVAEYRASEGKEVSIPYKGPVEPTIKEILGGIRSACTYIGAESIDQMHRKAKFIRVNRQINNVFGS
jgi:GMP reductase